MSTENSWIQKDAGGTTVPIEEVLVPARVFDPLMETTIEASDILARNCVPSSRNFSKNLLPINFPRYRCADDFPSRATWVSPGQSIFLPLSRPGKKHCKIDETDAIDLLNCSDIVQITQQKPITNRADICDRVQYMRVNGTSMKTFDPTCFEAASKSLQNKESRYG